MSSYCTWCETPAETKVATYCHECGKMYSDVSIELINCTPHTVNIWDDKGETELSVLPASGILPRVSVETHVTHYISNIPIFVTQFGEVKNLPEKENGKFLIVSRMVLDAAPNRDDLLTVGELIRRKLDDGNTIIVGCKGLSR